jgi:hypothetical protein
VNCAATIKQNQFKVTDQELVTRRGAHYALPSVLQTQGTRTCMDIDFPPKGTHTPSVYSFKTTRLAL